MIHLPSKCILLFNTTPDCLYFRLSQYVIASRLQFLLLQLLQGNEIHLNLLNARYVYNAFQYDFIIKIFQKQKSNKKSLNMTSLIFH